MKFDKKSIAAMLVTMATAFAISGCGDAKIGYINGTRIMSEAPQIKSIITEGNQKIQEAQAQAENDFASKQDSMSVEDMQIAQREIQQKLMTLNQQYSLQIKQKLDTALADVSQEKKLDAIVDNEEDAKIIIKGGEDVTDAVIAKLQ